MEEWARSPIVHKSYPSPWGRCRSRSMMTQQTSALTRWTRSTTAKTRRHTRTHARAERVAVSLVSAPHSWSRKSGGNSPTTCESRSLNMSGQYWKYSREYFRDGKCFCCHPEKTKQKRKSLMWKTTSATIMGFFRAPVCSAALLRPLSARRRAAAASLGISEDIYGQKKKVNK